METTARPLNEKQRLEAWNIYLILSAMFIACLVAGNLIFQKFFIWYPLGLLHSGPGEPTGLASFAFELSVGIIPYPLTFLITDIISEIYGRKKANQVVVAGLFSTLVVFLIVLLSEGAQATSYSPVDNDTFTRVFGLTGVAVTASMIAYLCAQFIDIRIFHFWKTITQGKHLWLRNNFSTITSQFVDTMLVIGLLCAFGSLDWSRFWPLTINGFLFKALIALLDTPLFYVTTHFIRKRYGLSLGQELTAL